MLQTHVYHSLQFDIATAESGSICYLLMPEVPSRDALKWLEEMAERFACTMVFVTGFDWENAFSPWPAEGLKKGEWFKGSAGMTLSELESDYFPFIEKPLKLANPTRYLVGTSLSGLFSIWAAHKSEAFSAVASVSGSLWYDGFPEWTAKHRLSGSIKRIDLSLGEREKNTKHPRMARVEDATREVSETLAAQEIPVLLELNPGSHFSPTLPRLEKTLAFLFSES